MKVYVRLYAFLAERVSGVRSGTRMEIILPEGSTVGTLVDQLALPKDIVKLAYVNGLMQKLDYRLQPEDEVGIFPPIAGG
jgi:molybdopterin converting factor small subunit